MILSLTFKVLGFIKSIYIRLYDIIIMEVNKRDEAKHLKINSLTNKHLLQAARCKNRSELLHNSGMTSVSPFLQKF